MLPASHARGAYVAKIDAEARGPRTKSLASAGRGTAQGGAVDDAGAGLCRGLHRDRECRIGGRDLGLDTGFPNREAPRRTSGANGPVTRATCRCFMPRATCRLGRPNLSLVSSPASWP